MTAKLGSALEAEPARETFQVKTGHLYWQDR